eukprot:3612815-Prymnesium_polylepis.1
MFNTIVLATVAAATWPAIRSRGGSATALSVPPPAPRARQPKHVVELRHERPGADPLLAVRPVHAVGGPRDDA